MQDYPSYESHLILSGFSEGFSIRFQGKLSANDCDNHNSAKDNLSELNAKIQAEIIAGRVAGPFKLPPLSNLNISPLGLIPKKDGKFRLIHNLSYPPGNCVNEGIPEQFCTVQYQTLDHAIQIIQSLGREVYVAKADIQDAFRLIPIKPDDYHLLGFRVNSSFYYDKCLPMGCSSSCQIFELFTTFIHWLLQEKFGVKHIVHILDDFMFFGKDYSECKSYLNSFIDLADDINMPIKHSKTVLPSTVVTLFGVEVDTKAGEIRMPAEKVAKLKQLLADMAGQSKVTVHALQSLLGLLNFACLAVSPGRAFMKRLQTLLCRLKNPKPYFLISLTRDARADIEAWRYFITSKFNGKSFFLHPSWSDSLKMQLFTDAAQSTGCAAVYGKRWFFIPWPQTWKMKNIAFLELFPIIVALEIWGYLWKNHQIFFRTDNQAVAEIINKQSSRDPNIMSLVRRLVIANMSFNVHFIARHIPGTENKIADLISRFQISRAMQLEPRLNAHPTSVPPHLLPLE